VAKVVFGCVSAAVLVAGSMTQVAQVVVGHSAVVFGTEGARHTRLSEVLSSCPDTVAAVAADPAVGDEVGQRNYPTGSGVDSCVTSVFSCRTNESVINWYLKRFLSYKLLIF
jgi:hypothetical protein